MEEVAEAIRVAEAAITAINRINSIKDRTNISSRIRISNKIRQQMSAKALPLEMHRYNTMEEHQHNLTTKVEIEADLGEEEVVAIEEVQPVEATKMANRIKTLSNKINKQVFHTGSKNYKIKKQLRACRMNHN